MNQFTYHADIIGLLVAELKCTSGELDSSKTKINDSSMMWNQFSLGEIQNDVLYALEIIGSHLSLQVINELETLSESLGNNDQLVAEVDNSGYRQMLG